MELGANLRRLRKMAGLTQEALAVRLHVTGQAVSHWEIGDTYPEITLLPQLAEVFGVTVDQLLRSELSEADMAEIQKEEIRIAGEESDVAAATYLESQLLIYPGNESLLQRLSSLQLWIARRLLAEGNAAEAETYLKKVERSAETLSASEDPHMRKWAEGMLPEIYYRLRERDKLENIMHIAGSSALPSLANCTVGKDTIWVFENAVFNTILQLDQRLEYLAYRPAKDSGKTWHDPTRKGEPLLYRPLKSEDDWEIGNEERMEIQAYRAELLEQCSGGVGFGDYRLRETYALGEMIRLAAKLQNRERVLQTLELFLKRFGIAELVEWERTRIAATERFRTLTVNLRQRGSEDPEAEAAGKLSPTELKYVTEAVSPLPMLRHICLGRIWMRGRPMLPTRWQELLELLDEPRFDFVREEPRFMSAAEVIRKLLNEL